MKTLLSALLMTGMMLGQAKQKTICVGFSNRLCDEVLPVNWRTFRYLLDESWEGRAIFSRKNTLVPVMSLYGDGGYYLVSLNGRNQIWDGFNVTVVDQNYVLFPEPPELSGGRGNCPEHRSNAHMVCWSGYTEPTVDPRKFDVLVKGQAMKSFVATLLLGV